MLMSIIDTIKQMKTNEVFERYIDFIQFPLYRNIELDTRIVFDFPLTVFTGQNGCGKSSALHALWGTVQGNTPYRFWFDTKIDPIEYIGEKRRRQSFWYSYKEANGKVKEVVKARIKRKDDPNYWETSRPIVDYGMQNLEGARNTPLKKVCLYLDFRSELSAFDQFFYFGNVSKNKSKNNQEYLRRKSSQLKSILDGTKPTQFNSVGKPRDCKLNSVQNH
jgi:predicted ATP-dependent endonuclease of OLD family